MMSLSWGWTLCQGRGHTTHLWDDRKECWEIIALNADDICKYEDDDDVCDDDDYDDFYDDDYDDGVCNIDVDNNLWDEGKDGREVWKQVFSRDVRHLWGEKVSISKKVLWREIAKRWVDCIATWLF